MSKKPSRKKDSFIKKMDKKIYLDICYRSWFFVILAILVTVGMISLVGYLVTRSAGGQINIVGDIKPSIVYQDEGPSPGAFVDDFSDVDFEERPIWQDDYGGDANVYAQDGEIRMNASGSGYRASVRTSQYHPGFDLNDLGEPFFAQINLRILNFDNGGDSKITFGIYDEATEADHYAKIQIGPGYGVGYDYRDGVHNNNGVIDSDAFPDSPQDYLLTLRIEADSPPPSTKVRFTAILDYDYGDSDEYVSEWLDFDNWENTYEIEFEISEGIPNEEFSATVHWDDLVTNFPIPGTPAGYFIDGKAMEFDGVEYSDIVMWFGGENPTPLPVIASEDEMQFAYGGGSSMRDVYVYLIQVAGIGNVTAYDVKTPAEFSVLVLPMLSQFLETPVQSAAYTIALAWNGGSYDALEPPLISMGSIVTNCEVVDGEWSCTSTFIPVGGASTMRPPAYSPIKQPLSDVSPAPIDSDIVVEKDSLNLDQIFERVKRLEERIGKLEEGVKAQNNLSTIPQKQESSISHQTYIVQPKDYLYLIAQKVYGNSARWYDLVNLNKEKYPKIAVPPHTIEIGWVLKY